MKISYPLQEFPWKDKMTHNDPKVIYNQIIHLENSWNENKKDGICMMGFIIEKENVDSSFLIGLNQEHCILIHSQLGSNQISTNIEIRQKGFKSVMFEQWTDFENHHFIKRQKGLNALIIWLKEDKLDPRIQWTQEDY
ncbi:MAG: hypothetical protein MRY83_05450 [Flavobacteriales bacterium]|nr:hypothetical protein [Flavobacteriales bacterium]